MLSIAFLALRVKPEPTPRMILTIPVLTTMEVLAQLFPHQMCSGLNLVITKACQLVTLLKYSLQTVTITSQFKNIYGLTLGTSLVSDL